MFTLFRRELLYSALPLFLAAIPVLIATSTLVAVLALSKSVANAIESSGRGLVGADVAVRRFGAFSNRDMIFLRSIADEMAVQSIRPELVMFRGGTDYSKNVSVLRMEGRFPFYGRADDAFGLFRSEAAKGNAVALVEDGLAPQAGLPGTLEIDGKVYRVVGGFRALVGDKVIRSGAQPLRVVVAALPQGSSPDARQTPSEHIVYLRFSDAGNAAAKIKELRDHFSGVPVKIDTPEERKSMAQKELTEARSFLAIVGYGLLCVAAGNLACSMYYYLSNRLEAVGMLRCLGMNQRAAFSIYALTCLTVVAAAIVVGVPGGAIVLRFAAVAFGSMAPAIKVGGLELWPSILVGLLCLLISLAMAAAPLARFWNTPPWRAGDSVRASASSTVSRLMQAILIAFLVAVLFAFSTWQTGDFLQSAKLSAVLLGSMLTIYGAARLVLRLLRHRSRTASQFLIEAAVASLHRPKNNSVLVVFVLAISIASSLSIAIINYSLNASIKNRVEKIGNIIFYGVHATDIERVRDFASKNGIRIASEFPIADAKLTRVGSGTPRSTEQDRALRRIVSGGVGLSVTARKAELPSERLVAGRFYSHIPPGSDIVPVLLEEAFARETGLRLGDATTWEINGVAITAFVGGIFKGWNHSEAEFTAIFPDNGDVRKSSHFARHVVMFSADDAAIRILQNVRSEHFKYVYVLNITAELESVARMIHSIFDALSLLTLLVAVVACLLIASTLACTSPARCEENSILSTLGLSRLKIRLLRSTEFSLLGACGTAIGVLLSLLLSAMACNQLYRVDTYWPIWLVGACVAGVIPLVAGISLVADALIGIRLRSAGFCQE